MSRTFQYDTLDVLNRAEKSADDWWANTLKNAKARTDLDQQEFKNAFENDKTMQTYGSDLFKTNNENIYKGTKASYDTMLEPDRYNTQKLTYGRDGLRAQDGIMQLQNAMSPENWAARVKVYDNNFQSPAAMLDANAASAGIADVGERNRIAGEVAQGYGGALGAQAVYGQNQRQANSLNIGNMIMGGSLDQANEHMARAGVNMKLETGQRPGTLVIVNPDGTRSAPMSASNAAKVFNDMTGGAAGQSQVYTDRTDAEFRKQDHETGLNNAKLAERNAHWQQQMQTAEGQRLNGALRAAEATGDKEKIQAAWNDVQSFQQRAGAAFDQGAGRPGQSFDMAGLMRSDEGMKLNRAYQEAAASGDKTKAAQAFAAVQAFKNKALTEHNIQAGVVNSPFVSDADLIKGAAPAPAAAAPAANGTGLLDTVSNWFKGQPAQTQTYAPPANAAPAPAAPTAKASVYQPVDSAEPQLWKPGQAVDDDSMAKIEQVRTAAESKLNQVRSDWQRANSLQGRGAVTDQMRQRIKAALDAAQADADRANSQYAGAKREWDRARGEAAYSPSRALQQSRAAAMDRDFVERYVK
jgi:hypothetical protein